MLEECAIPLKTGPHAPSKRKEKHPAKGAVQKITRDFFSTLQRFKNAYFALRTYLSGCTSAIRNSDTSADTSLTSGQRHHNKLVLEI